MLDVEALTQATATLRSLIAAGPRAWDGAPEEVVVAALGAAADLSRSCDAVKIAAAGAVARRSEPLTPIESLARRLGHSNTRRLVMDVFGVNGYVAGAWIEVAAAVQPRTGISTGDLPPARPAVAAALEAGELSADIAKAIVEQLSKLTGETVNGGTAVAEAALVANATGGRINLFKPTHPAEPAPAAGPAPVQSGGPEEPGEGFLEFPTPPPDSQPDSRMTPWGQLGGAPWERGESSMNPGGYPPSEDTRARAGLAWFGHQNDPTTPNAGAPFGAGAGFGQGSNPGAGYGSSPDAGAPFGTGAGTGSATDPGSGYGPAAGSPFGADPSFGSGAGAGGAWPHHQAQQQRPEPPVPFNPVLPPSMDERSSRRGAGSAISGGRVGLERIKEESKGWGLVLDPDGAEPRYEQQRR
ncbi:MAG: DUF222 domain-containing protein, partial [Arthrobacter sp.]|nr:DUF222 domain-containing protein [Arthrobacter sp.]